MATRKTTNSAQDNEQFKRDINRVRGWVSAELRKNGIDIDVRLLTTISVMTSAGLKFIQNEATQEETRASFDNAIGMYRNDSLPF